jgi:transcriptional regulator with XRE-family HTH domain
VESATVDRSMSKEIGRRIMIFRTGIGMQQSDLAKKLGLSQPHISYIEKGQRTISVDTLASIAAVLNCRIVDLLPVSQGGRPLD